MPVPLDKLKDWALVVGPASCLVILSLFALWVGHEPGEGRFAVSFSPLPDISVSVPATETLKRQDAGIASMAVTGLPDPFGRQAPVIKAGIKAQPVLEELALSLVVVANGERYCRVNGRLLREGEKWAGFAVRKVALTGVLFDTDAGRIFLKPGQKENIILGPGDDTAPSLNGSQPESKPESKKDKENA